MANKLLTANQKTVNFKMYKHGKQWVFTSATALALALAGTTVTAHADTTAATTTTGGQGQSAQVTQPATQNQAGAGAADTITTYPHKDVIDNAVKGAQGTEGLEIIKDNDQTIKADNQADAAQQIEKDYNSQVQDIKDAQTRVEKGRHQQSNYQTYNNMHGDTSSLDQAVQDAKGIPGLNVVKDADNKSSFSSDDDDALAKWGTVTQKEYQSEVDAINKAVDTQKRNEAVYEEEMQKWRTSNPNNEQALTTEDVKQHLSLGREPGASLNIISTNGTEDESFFWPYGWIQQGVNEHSYGTNTDDFEKMKQAAKMDSQSVKTIVFPANASGNVTVEYSGLANSNYVDSNGNKVNISKIRITYTVASSNLKHGIIIFSDPTDGFGELNTDNITLSNFSFYDSEGNKINLENGTAYLAVTSLNHHSQGLIETVTGGPGTTAFALAGSSVTLHDGNSLYADHNNEDLAHGGDWDLAAHGGQSWDNKGAYEYYGSGLLSLSGSDFTVSFSTQSTNGNSVVQEPGNGPWFTFTTLIPETPTPKLKTTEVHYHYNTAIVTPPTQPTHETVHYHYDAYNYTPNAQKHFVDHGQISDNKVYADGSAITAQIDSTLPDAANFPDGLKSVVLDEDYSNYAKYVTSGDVSKVKITDLSNNSDVTNDFTITDDGQGHMTITLKDPSKAKGQTIRVTPSWTINKDVADQTALKNVAMLVVNGVKGDPATATVTTYNAKPHKDVELGDNVQGDTPNSIAGQTVPAGTVVTFPLSSNDLPANREQDVVTVVWSDILDDNLDYQSYKAYLPDANGQLIDVTDHVKLDQNGKNLKFTWDDYLIQLANENKASAFKKPVIDLVAKVNGNSIVATNKFDEAMTFKDLTGNQTNVDVTSNEVSVKTPDAPKPQKEDLNDQGQNIDGQEVTAGQHITYQLDWNFINDKGITASSGDIAKGFFFADPIDSNALEAGDLSKAQVIDENGNKVSGVSIKLYNSLSEAPELFQQEVKENGLTDKFSHGPFFLASADDPQDFFTKYVSAGKRLKVDIPTVVKDGYNGTFSNTAWQFEFGKATPTNTVTNTVKPSPKPAPTPVSTPRPASPAPAAPAAPQAALPQTGNNNNTAVIGLAIAGLAASMALAGLGLRKKN